MKQMRYFVLLAALIVVATGCGKKEEDKVASPHETGEVPLQEQQYTGPAEVMVSEEVKASWKAIEIEIVNNETGEKQAVTINIGEEKEIEGTSLKIKAISFLPAFQMDGPIVTSISNEVENPAAQIEVSEEGKESWSGWLFVLYPTTHAFTHPNFSITLLDGVAAEKD